MFNAVPHFATSMAVHSVTLEVFVGQHTSRTTRNYTV